MEIRTEGLVKTYGGRRVVNQVDIRVKAGHVVGLLGPNGAGKTTTFYMIVGIVRPDEGDIYIDDRCITAEPIHRRARYGLSYLPQEASVFRRMSVRDNLLSVLETREELSDDERQQRADRLISELRLDHVADRLGRELSGGERRRAEIARSLTTDPAFILLDEPFAGVDPIAVADIQDVIRSLRKRGIGVLITDHNVRETLSIVDTAYIISEGKVLLEGDADTIANDPTARKFYLGDSFRLQ